MNNKITLKYRLIATAIATVLIWVHLAWDFFHGGVPTHHLLHRADLPGISNWWGLVVLPLLTWLLLKRINKRINRAIESNKQSTPPLYGFIGALLTGLILSFFFTIGSEMPGYILIGLFALSFFVPLFRAEHYLGFVIGMMYTFGVMLPVGFGAIFSIVFFITYHIVIVIKSKLVSKDA